MRGLEQLITQIKAKVTMGQPVESIAQDFLSQGMDIDLVYWALRAAQLDMSKLKEKQNA